MPSRYLVGIDLGTTNCALAYIDAQEADTSRIQVFPVPQLVASGEVQTLPGLPSFIYFPTPEELTSRSFSATWDEDPAMVTGVLAREQGALVPSRQVSSAKSWLSFGGANRRGKILPAQAEPPQPMISPVEASARYIMHLRDAWNANIGSDRENRLENQGIVLTVPASFDEEARELTVEAARRAGLERLTLLEEPLAAFYAWIAANRSESADGSNADELGGHDCILICDVGGGTSDFSLIRSRSFDGEWQFERVAVGEHVLLGGDNLDLALAQIVESKLGSKLSLRQRYALRRACSAAKERLLSDRSLQELPVTILGSGRSVISGALTVNLTREEVVRTLADGFLPVTSPEDMPARSRTTALRELGLPYATDPAITRHLAAFLAQAARSMELEDRSPVRPDAILFNGGFFAPAVARERVVEAISNWFRHSHPDWRPKLLENEQVDSAVARGAAYYGLVRQGNGLRVRAGSAHTYYVGLPSQDGLNAICVLPAGTQEGTTLPLLERDFSVLANRPVSFTLYSSRLRHDPSGQVVRLNEDSVHRHAPLVTLLRFGKKLRDRELTVRLRTSFTELGTLELWCESRETAHRWRLQFELRGEEAQDSRRAEQPPLRVVPPSAAPSVKDASVGSAVQLIRNTFADRGGLRPAETLVSQIESVLGSKRDAWPITTVRHLAEVLLEVESGRRRSARHEVRWFNLAGFCLRPGFGDRGDELLIPRATRIASELFFPDDVPCQIERLVFLRRIAGGIPSSEQHALFRANVAPLRFSRSGRGKRKLRLNPQLEYELWRLLANLEQVSASNRATAGNRLLAKIQEQPHDAMLLWCLGRFGSRIPLYGVLHSVVAKEIAGDWLKIVLATPQISSALSHAVSQIARCTGDPARDIDASLRKEAISTLTALGGDPEDLRLLSEPRDPDFTDAVRSFGESLPSGLHVLSSSTCLLSVPGLLSRSDDLTGERA